MYVSEHDVTHLVGSLFQPEFLTENSDILGFFIFEAYLDHMNIKHTDAHIIGSQLAKTSAISKSMRNILGQEDECRLQIDERNVNQFIRLLEPKIQDDWVAFAFDRSKLDEPLKTLAKYQTRITLDKYRFLQLHGTYILVLQDKNDATLFKLATP